MDSLNHDMNNLDALFRKAAESYPLKSGDGDWENVSGKLLHKPKSTFPVNRNNRRKYFGLVFLFLSVSATLFFYSGSYRNESKYGLKPVNQNALSGKDKSATHGANLKPPSIAQTYNQTGQTLKAGPVNPETGKRKNTDNKYSNETFTGNNAGEVLIRDKREYFDGRITSLSWPIVKEQKISIFEPASPYEEIGLKRNLPLNYSDRLLYDLSLTHKIDNDKAFLKKSKHGMYLGLTFGLDFSRIKSQAIERTGYNLGLLAGYRMNQKLSIESGIQWSRKKYYTDGKYFSMDNGNSMPANMKIMTVHGQMTLLEVPLELKYDITPKKNSNLFISAGMLSNIYISEENKYLTEMNGVMEYNNALYKDVSYSLISLLNVSAGYEHSVGKSGIIRFEPYIKIPLKKEGVGNLSVFSTGINVSILNPLSRKIP